jgi:hypothetical protein
MSRNWLTTALATLGGAGGGYLRQRQIDNDTDLERQRADAYSRMMDGQVTRDNAYAAGIAAKEKAAGVERAGLIAYLKANGMGDIPPGAETEAFKALLAQRAETGRNTRAEGGFEAALDRILKGGALRNSGAMERQRLIIENRRDPDDDFESRNRMKNTWIATMIDAYGPNALREVERTPHLREKAIEMGLKNEDWLAADARRRRAATKTQKRTGRSFFPTP